MAKMHFLRILAALTATGHLASAHPGQSQLSRRAEAKARLEFLASLKDTDLSKCAPRLSVRGVVERTVARRKERVIQLQKEHFDESDSGLQKRQSKYNFEEVLGKSHKASLNLGSSPLNADWALLGQNKSTVMQPETTEGPYYVTGESIRKNVIDNEPGVKLYLDIQIIDISTCKPIPNAAIEIWGANSSGIYSGVAGFANAGPTDPRILNSKALRGIQISGKDGEVQFETIMPGHYFGRTNHVHVMSHVGHTVLANNTIKGGRISHIGQLYFDQDLLDQISVIPPYSENKGLRLKNNQDILMAANTLGRHDPVMEYVLLGNRVEDGVFAWINFGIDARTNIEVIPAAECGANGCKASEVALNPPEGGPVSLGPGGPAMSGVPPWMLAMPPMPTETPKGFVSPPEGVGIPFIQVAADQRAGKGRPPVVAGVAAPAIAS